MPQTHRQALPQGYMLQEYQLGRVLGAGGFGLTYWGWDTVLDKPVAIKEYLPNDLAVRAAGYSVAAKSGGDEDNFRWGLNRFLDEARTLAKFKHPNIVSVHRCFEAHGTAYIVMEFVEGETLHAYLKRTGKPKESFLRALITALLDGLAEVHRAGFMHRDIKPGNIIITADGAPVLVDFGAARQEVGGKSRSITSVVTPGYAPIEQYSTRGKQGPWTDIYALGAVAYRAITGETPLDATERVLDDALIPAADAGRDKYSANFLRAIDAALAVDKNDRLQSVDAWRRVLAADAPARKPAVAEPPAKPKVKPEVGWKAGEKKSSGWVWAAAVVGVLIVGGLAAKWDSYQRQEAELAGQEAALVAAQEQLAQEQAAEKRRAEATAKREAERLAREKAARREAEKRRAEEAERQAALAAEEKRRAEAAAKREVERLAREEAARQKQIEEERQRAAAEAAISRLTPKCTQPLIKGEAPCWLKAANRPDCYHWNLRPQNHQSVEWSGRCNNGEPDGHGEIVWRWDSHQIESKETGSGSFVYGKKHGQWVERFANGAVYEGAYKDGKKHGQWVERFANGAVYEGAYKDGKKHGQWVWRSPNGDVEKVSYKDGKRHGRWVKRYADGKSFYACFENDKRIDC